MRAGVDPERGSVTPLVLGFFLLALIIVAGSVSLGDAFTKQRYLQSVCDGAAVAAANSADPALLHGGGVPGAALPLTAANAAVTTYLRHTENRGISASAVVRGRQTVAVTCTWHTHVALGAVIGRPGGVDQKARSIARSPIQP